MGRNNRRDVGTSFLRNSATSLRDGKHVIIIYKQTIKQDNKEKSQTEGCSILNEK